MGSDATSAVAAVTARELARQLALQWSQPRIVKLELILTERCNLACTYCFELAKDSGKVMTPEIARGAIDFLVEASRDSDWIGISFMGGEPMERFELLQQAVAYARDVAERAKKSVSFDMTTNGTLLDERHLAYFRDVGLRYLLSLDGLEEDHDRHRPDRGGRGSFRRVVEYLRTMKRYQHWQGARMTVMPDTARRLRDNVAGLHGLGINQFVLGFATHTEWTEDAVVELHRALQRTCDYYLSERIDRRSRRLRIGLFEKGELTLALADRPPVGDAFGCGAGSGRLAVTPAGVYHGCSKLAWGKSGSESAPLPLGTVASGLNRPENRARLLEHTLAPRGKCQTCELRHSCQGGCYAANHAATGDVYTPPDDFCRLMFALKDTSDYVRRRMSEHGVTSLAWGTDLPDLEDVEGARVAS